MLHAPAPNPTLPPRPHLLLTVQGPEHEKALALAPKVPTGWPRSGAITFDRVVMKYAPHLPPALRGVSFNIKSGEKVRPKGLGAAGTAQLPAHHGPRPCQAAGPKRSPAGCPAPSPAGGRGGPHRQWQEHPAAGVVPHVQPGGKGGDRTGRGWGRLRVPQVLSQHYRCTQLGALGPRAHNDMA